MKTPPTKRERGLETYVRKLLTYNSDLRDELAKCQDTLDILMDLVIEYQTRLEDAGIPVE